MNNNREINSPMENFSDFNRQLLDIIGVHMRMCQLLIFIKSNHAYVQIHKYDLQSLFIFLLLSTHTI